MANTSVVPQAIDALVSIVGNLPTLVDNTVTYDVPLTWTDEYVWFGQVEPWVQELVTMPGDVFRSEAFTIDGVIGVRSKGNSAIEARDRAFAILAAMEVALRPKLDLDGVDGVLTAVLVPRSSTPFEEGDGEGRSHEIEFGINVSSFLGDG